MDNTLITPFVRRFSLLLWKLANPQILDTGSMSREERRAALKCISSKRGPRPCRVILVSIGAGGSGTFFSLPNLMMTLMIYG
jgi:hypothetical protein